MALRTQHRMHVLGLTAVESEDHAIIMRDSTVAASSHAWALRQAFQTGGYDLALYILGTYPSILEFAVDEVWGELQLPHLLGSPAGAWRADRLAKCWCVSQF
ncbi:unnamed protein product [Symbiodinium sp. CCMP2592]|nr:unnamed protein product [Symbiodinium sp. CCMP2592]